jgi:transposase
MRRDPGVQGRATGNRQGCSSTTARAGAGKDPMSYRELTMIEVKEVLRRWRAGQSLRAMSRETGLDRKTVRRYVESASELGLAHVGDVTDEEARDVLQQVTDREMPAPSAERAQLAPHRVQIEEWLTGPKPLKLTKVHDLLARRGVEITYATLRRFVIDELGWHKRVPTVRIDDAAPGEEAQVDYGKVGRLLDESTGRVRDLWALIVTLTFSRHMFVIPMFTQTTEAVCAGLDEAWRYFGGVVRRIVPDNMSAIVDDANPEHPKIVEAFAEYAQSRGFFVDPTRVAHPKDKPRVENQVAYVRESCFEGESFAGLDESVRWAREWCTSKAGTRVHGTTRRVPIEMFIANERPLLLPAPTSPFDVPTWTDAKVHPDHHVQVARALYSLPTRFIGREVRVRYDRSIVRIYLRHELIKTHPRQLPGGRSTDPNDYPVGRAPLAMRSVEQLVREATKRGEHVGIYASRLFDVTVPWSRLRQAQQLVRLCDKYGDRRVDERCRSAIAFDVIDVPRIARMLKSAAHVHEEGEREGKVFTLPSGRFARDPKSFATTSSLRSENEVTP